MITATVLLPWIIPAIVVAVSIYLAPEIEKFLQVKADNSRREYLNEAIMNGIMSAKIEDPNGLDDYVIKQTVEYVKTTVPEAVKELKLKDAALRLLIRSHLHIFGSEQENMEHIL